MTLSHVMLAIEISEPGGPDVLKPVIVPVPVPGHGQIVIRVAYAGVNRPDALQRAGAYAPPPTASPLPGLEGVRPGGRDRARGDPLAIGDPVCALLPGGGYAEYARHPCRPRLADPDGHGPAASGLPARDLLYRLVERGDARRSEGGRAVSGAWRHRPASARRRSRSPRRWARGCSRPPDRTRNARSAWRWAPKGRSTTAPRISSRCCKAEGGANLILDMVGGSYLPTQHQGAGR